MPISEHRTDAKLTDLLVTLANGRRRVGSQSMTAVAPAMGWLTIPGVCPRLAEVGRQGTGRGRSEIAFWSITRRRSIGSIEARSETGGPPTRTPTREGFGGRIIKQMAEQLKGAARFKWRAKGLDCEINLQT
jgi:hypothetical protein